MSLIFIEVEAEVTDIIPFITEVMSEAEEITDRGPMVETEEDTFLLEPNPEVLVIHEGHIEGQIPTEIEGIADK